MTVDDMTQGKDKTTRSDGTLPEEATGDEASDEAVVAEHADSGSEESASESLQSDLNALREELGQASDRALRAQAELDNYRKRMNRELQDSLRYAAVNIIRDLLPVVDNLQRALEAAQAAGEDSSLLQGVQMVAQQMDGILTQHGLSPIEAQGQPFDPDLHEAVSQQPTADAEPGTVLHVVQSGYQVADRVVRPAKVIVAQSASGD